MANFFCICIYTHLMPLGICRTIVQGSPNPAILAGTSSGHSQYIAGCMDLNPPCRHLKILCHVRLVFIVARDNLVHTSTYNNITY